MAEVKEEEKEAAPIPPSVDTDLDALLGPQSGSRLVDDYSRHLAFDLLVDPAGARHLAVCMIANAHERPLKARPLQALTALFDNLLDSTLCLELDAFVLNGTTAEYIVQLSRKAQNTPVLHSRTLRMGCCWRTLLALSELAALREDDTPFLRHEVRDVLTPLRIWSFRGDAMLQFYYDPKYLIVLCLEHFLVDFFATPAVAAIDPGVLTNLNLLLSRYFGQRAALAPADSEVRRLLADLAKLFVDHCHHQRRLTAAVVAIADEMRGQKRAFGQFVLRHWRTKSVS